MATAQQTPISNGPETAAPGACSSPHEHSSAPACAELRDNGTQAQVYQQLLSHCIFNGPTRLSPRSSARSGTIGRLTERTMAAMRQTHIITPSAPGTKASRCWGTAWSKREPCCIHTSGSAPDDLLSEVDLQAQARGHRLLWCSLEEATHFS